MAPAIRNSASGRGFFVVEVRLATWLERPVLAQRDKRWAKTLMGKSPLSTIGDYGCLLTCSATLAGITPPEMNAIWMAKGGYQLAPGKEAYAATFDFQKLHPAAPEILDYSGRYESAPFPRADIDRLIAHLKTGRPALLEVDMTPGTGANDMHYVLAVSAFGSGASANIIIDDPWFGDQNLLTPRYGFSLAQALIRAMYYGG